MPERIIPVGHHQTITRNRAGVLVPADCPCGEDHGPSVREELQIERERARLAKESAR